MGHELSAISCFFQPVHNFFGDFKLRPDVTHMAITPAFKEARRVKQELVESREGADIAQGVVPCPIDHMDEPREL
jgi:hypothetical protein